LVKSLAKTIPPSDAKGLFKTLALKMYTVEQEEGGIARWPDLQSCTIVALRGKSRTSAPETRSLVKEAAI